MSLSDNQKRYIDENYQVTGIMKMQNALKIPRTEITKYMEQMGYHTKAEIEKQNKQKEKMEMRDGIFDVHAMRNWLVGEDGSYYGQSY